MVDVHGPGLSAHATDWAQRRMGGITIYIALLCLRIMYVHMLNQLFREYSSLDIAGNLERGERERAGLDYTI